MQKTYYSLILIINKKKKHEKRFSADFRKMLVPSYWPKSCKKGRF
jgi:hypothetical protein